MFTNTINFIRSKMDEPPRANLTTVCIVILIFSTILCGAILFLLAAARLGFFACFLVPVIAFLFLMWEANKKE